MSSSILVLTGLEPRRISTSIEVGVVLPSRVISVIWYSIWVLHIVYMFRRNNMTVDRIISSPTHLALRNGFDTHLLQHLLDRGNLSS
jgi:hypothetical protein